MQHFYYKNHDLPSEFLFVRASCEDGTFFSAVRREYLKEYILELKLGAYYNIAAVPRKDVPPCLFRFFSGGLSFYFDAAWNDGENAYIDERNTTRIVNRNGATFRLSDWGSINCYMDDDTREELYRELAPCSEQEFFTAYAEAHEKKFREQWELDKANPTW